MDIVQAAGNNQMPPNCIYESRAIQQVKEIVVCGNVNVIFKPSGEMRMVIAGEFTEGIKSVKTNIQNNRLTIERANSSLSTGNFSFHHTSTFSTSSSGTGHNVMSSQSIYVSGSGASTFSVNVNGRPVGPEDSDGRIVVGIALPYAPVIDNQGQGKIILQELQQDCLDVKVVNVGQVEAMGQVKDLEVLASGQGRIDASKLVADRANFEVSGAARVDAEVRQHVRSHISGVAKVNIRGNPTLRNDVMSGLGRIRYT